MYDQGYYDGLIGSLYALSIVPKLPKSMTLDDLERLIRTLAEKIRLTEPDRKM